MLALIGCHRVNYCLNALESVVADIYILNGLAHTRNHRSEVLEVTHLLDFRDLREEVVEVKLVLGNLLLQLASLLLVILLLHAVNERHDITHVENAVGHTSGTEWVDCLHLLASTHPLDGLVDNSAD